MLLFDGLNACALCFSPFITFDNVRSCFTKRQDMLPVTLAWCFITTQNYFSHVTLSEFLIIFKYWLCNAIHLPSIPYLSKLLYLILTFDNHQLMRRRRWEGGEVGAMRPAFLKISKEPKKMKNLEAVSLDDFLFPYKQNKGLLA